MAKLLAVSVINDVHTDNRLHRTCSVWRDRGYEVVVYGRNFPNKAPVVDRPYEVKRFSCTFTKGPFFYLEYSLRLFKALQHIRPDVYLANDLDTLWPNAFWAWRRGKPLVYDSHEYYCGVPELARRPVVRSMWRAIEKACIPFVTEAVTVSSSIAEAYQSEHGLPFTVIRNIPQSSHDPIPLLKQLDPLFDSTIPMVLLQGAGINVDRGAEELVASMALVNLPLQLYIIGSGDVLPALKKEVSRLGLQHKVIFKDRLPSLALKAYTQAATIGVSLDKPSNPNYTWSLPNKLFDFLQAGVPLIVSPVVEVAKIITSTGAGVVLPEVTPSAIAMALQAALEDKDGWGQKAANARAASVEYVWDKEVRHWHGVIDRTEGTNEQRVAIVSMDVPKEPLYGGTAEVWSQAVALAESGCPVDLHCFYSKREGFHGGFSHPNLRMYYYPRQGISAFLSSWPYIIASRASFPLLRRLLIGKIPIIAHGYHSLWPALFDKRLAARTFLRIHNPERLYYQSLREQAKGVKKLFFTREVWLLRRLEQKLFPHWPLAGAWALTPGDAAVLGPFFKPSVEVIHPGISPLPTDSDSSFASIEKPYVLFHGKLSVSENETAALLIARAARQHPSVRFVVAGHGASSALRAALQEANVHWVDSPRQEEMTWWLRGAAVHGLWALQAAGVKFKLLHALQSSGRVVGNALLVQGTGLESLVTVVDQEKEWIQSVVQAVHQPLDAAEREERRRVMEGWSPQRMVEQIRQRLDALGL